MAARLDLHKACAAVRTPVCGVSAEAAKEFVRTARRRQRHCITYITRYVRFSDSHTVASNSKPKTASMPSSHFTPLAAAGPTLSKPNVLARANKAFNHNFIRNQLTLQTWMLLGAFLQVLLFALPIRRLFAIAPVTLLLAWQVLDTVLMIFGLKHDVSMDGVLGTKHSALIPDEDGTFSRSATGNRSTPGGASVCVFLLGFRINQSVQSFC